MVRYVLFQWLYMFILVVDAMAKIPEALLDGKLHWPGSFHLCEEIQVNYTYYNRTYWSDGHPVEERKFTGEYCRMDLEPQGVSGVLYLEPQGVSGVLYLGSQGVSGVLYL